MISTENRSHIHLSPNHAKVTVVPEPVPMRLAMELYKTVPEITTPQGILSNV